MTSSCLSQFRGWNIPILVGVWRGHSSISSRFNGFIIYSYKLQNLVEISSSSCPSFHLKFSHHISALWSEAHLVSYSSLWGRFSCSSILYSDLNSLLFKFINLSGRKANKSHVLLLNNEETVPFPHYLVVNQCNFYGFEWIRKIMIVYRWMEFHWSIIWV